MKKIAIVKIGNCTVECIVYNDEKTSINEIVEKMQRNYQKCYTVNRYPSVKFKVAESNDIVKALIESKEF